MRIWRSGISGGWRKKPADTDKIFMEEISKDSMEQLRALARRAIERLSKMKQPVVRVCGPLTTGGAGYEKNLATFVKAEKVLSEKGYLVFNYFEEQDEALIRAMGAPHETIMREYHEPILRSGYIRTAFFLPGWRGSKGATWEHDFMSRETSTEIKDIPPEWLG